MSVWCSELADSSTLWIRYFLQKKNCLLCMYLCLCLCQCQCLCTMSVSKWWRDEKQRWWRLEHGGEWRQWKSFVRTLIATYVSIRGTTQTHQWQRFVRA